MLASVGTQADAVAEAGSARPYAPSWVDRVIDWIEALPMPARAFYLLVAVASILLVSSFHWYTGVYAPGTIFLFHVIVAIGPVSCVAVMHYLDRRAEVALKALRTALKVTSDDEFERLRYELTTMPSRPVALVTAVVFVVCVVVALLQITTGSILGFIAETLRVIKFAENTLAATVNASFIIATYPLVGVIGYHTIRQLILVERIHTTATRIDLFRRGPLYAFSGLSLRTAICLVAAVYVGIANTPSLVENPFVTLGIVQLTLFAAGIFIAPLMGAHRLMEEEKKRLLDVNGAQMEATIAEIHRRLGVNELDNIAQLKDALDSLVTEQSVIGKISTWPWQVGTVGVLATAIVLPVLLWIIQRLLERFAGF
jgi:hypothetical protein